MFEDEGLVSVIMPNFNCSRFIAQSIESVQNQTYKNWELLIQDDKSNDDSFDIALQYANKDPRIKIERNKCNSGAAITRNNAIRRATGRWIAFLDSDDLWSPTKLEEQIKFMVNNGYAFTYHVYDEIDEANQPLGIHVSGKKKVGKIGMYCCCWPGCLTVMYDAEKIGLVQIEDIKKNNDIAMWLKVIRKTKCYLLPKTLAKYRRRKGSITPPSIYQRILWHYRLFRIAEEMNPISSWLLTVLNVIGSTYKKTFFVKHTL